MSPKRIIDENQGSLIREVIRTVVVLATAFGANLSKDQTVAIYLATAAVLQLLVRWNAAKQ